MNEPITTEPVSVAVATDSLHFIPFRVTEYCPHTVGLTYPGDKAAPTLRQAMSNVGIGVADDEHLISQAIFKMYSEDSFYLTVKLPGVCPIVDLAQLKLTHYNDQALADFANIATSYIQGSDPISLQWGVE